MAITSDITLPDHHPFAGRSVASVFEERIAAFGDKPFLVWEPPQEAARAEWTFAAFGAAVDRAAAGLVERGVTKGDAVMLFLENSPALLISWFACARLGAVAVDTNVRYVADEVTHAGSLTEPVGVITHETLRDRLEGLPGDPWVVTVDEATGTCPELTGDPANLPAIDTAPTDALCVQFTSGTTSRPKAALYTNANALWAGMVGSAHNRTRSDDVVFVHAPLFHTMAMFWQTMPTFWMGATMVLAPKYSRTRFWDISLRNKCTHSFLLPIMFSLAEDPVPDHHYRQWITGLEIPEIEKAFGVRIQSCWGMTEVVTNVLMNDLDVPGTPRAIGRVAPEYSLRVVPDAESEAGDDPSVGELRVGGVPGLSLFAGYHRNPEATAEGFDDEGFWRTGDLVKLLPTGEVQFVSRIKDMLRVGGENVAAAEIERVLAEHPDVTAAGVVGYPDSARGEVPFGFVVAPGVDAEQLVASLNERCASGLADFKVPRRIEVLDELPESLIGKTSKKILKERAIELGLDGVT